MIHSSNTTFTISTSFFLLLLFVKLTMGIKLLPDHLHNYFSGSEAGTLLQLYFLLTQ
jgi:hypothetical protein